MPDEPPIAERILDAAEQALRRHGAEKATVVDVARALGMSHANIYRHFPSKRALLEAVAVRRMHEFARPTAPIAADRARPAEARLVAWLDAFRAAKRAKCEHDPELFRVYYDVAMGAPDSVDAHVAELVAQVAQILADGVASGAFHADLDVPAAARAFLVATSAFHHPAMVMHRPLATEADVRAVLDLILAGLRARSG